MVQKKSATDDDIHSRIKPDVYDRLWKLGRKGESISMIIARLIDYFELHTKD